MSDWTSDENTRALDTSLCSYHRLDTSGISLSHSVFLPRGAGACIGNGLSDATGHLLVRPDKAYEQHLRVHRIHSAAHPPAYPKYRLVLPSAHVFGFRRSAALSNGPCVLV